jgi:hypothetical protein
MFASAYLLCKFNSLKIKGLNGAREHLPSTQEVPIWRRDPTKQTMAGASHTRSQSSDQTGWLI